MTKTTIDALRHQHNFADIFSRLDVTMRFRNLIKGKSAIHVRMDPVFIDPVHDLFHPARNLFSFAPKVPEVQAKDAFVTTHQTQRIESRALYYSFEGP